MWRLKNWARIVTLVPAGLCLAAGPMSLLLISSHPAGLVMTAARRGVAPFVRVVSFFLVGVPWEVSLTVSAFVCWYLLRPAVKAALTGSGPAGVVNCLERAERNDARTIEVVLRLDVVTARDGHARQDDRVCCPDKLPKPPR
jgi:hypothetical protein